MREKSLVLSGSELWVFSVAFWVWRNIVIGHASRPLIINAVHRTALFTQTQLLWELWAWTFIFIEGIYLNFWISIAVKPAAKS